MKFENCTLQNNIIIDQAVITPLGGTVGMGGKADETARAGKETVSAEGHTASAARKPRRTHRDSPRLVQDVFFYRWIGDREGQAQLIKLYQKLILEEVGWLDPGVRPDDWCALFMGRPCNVTMKWLGTQAHLKFLFKCMLDRGYITNSSSFGPWEIVGSHFRDRDSRQFTNWNDVKDPKRYATVVEALADILDLSQLSQISEP